MIIVYIIIAGLIIVLLSGRKSNLNQPEVKEIKQEVGDVNVGIDTTTEEIMFEKITEEIIFEYENYFDKKIVEEVNFPDAIGGFEIFIYKNLMYPWFKKLSAENRYNNEMIQKLRFDWFNYMYFLEKSATWWYLSETGPPEKADRAISANKKFISIEDGFASLIGKDAIAELERTREIYKNNRWKFNDLGEKAPEGFEYIRLDSNDLREEK